MNLTRKMTGILTMATLVALLGSVAQAEDGVRQINSANQTLLDGNVDEALAQYQLAEQSVPASPLLAYNKGVAFYQQGNIEQARQSFTNAVDTDDPELASQAAFNLGNCHYATAVEQLTTDRNVAIESLRTAIAHYRSALQTNPSDADARFNIELARQLMQQLREQEEQEQSESSDSQGEKSDEQESDDSQSGENQSDESQSDESQSDQESADQEAEQQQSDDSKSDESKPDDASEEQNQADENSGGSNSQEPQPEQSEQQDPANSQDQDRENPEQQQAGEPMPQPGEQQETKPEQKPAQQGQAGEVAQQDQPADGQQTPGYAISRSGEPSENIDEEEAMKMLQAIRDRDLMRRMKKLNEKRRRHRPVDRDW
jgi:Ca-activated chloride channel family protein